MPYVNIPDSLIATSLAVVIGRLQSELVTKVMKNSGEIMKNIRDGGCPSRQDLERSLAKKSQMDRAFESISRKLTVFSKLPAKLKAPLRGLQIAIKVIKTLPIPQAVPPGFGLPILITTVYSDLLHLLKELVAQIKELVAAIIAILKTPAVYIASLRKVLDRTDTALQLCSLKVSIEEELDRLRQEDPSAVEPTLEMLKEAGVYNEAGEFAFKNVGASLFDGINLDNTVPTDNSIIKVQTPQGERTVVTNKEELASYTQENIQSEIIGKIEDTSNRLKTSRLPDSVKNNIQKILTDFQKSKEKFESNRDEEDKSRGKEYYIGPNGGYYSLEVLVDDSQAYITPRRYAVARDMEGIIVMKGPLSFSSSTKVLIEEIKFRIDNQLP